MQYGLDAFVFDMDGLMLDTEPLYKVAWQTASAELGHPIDDLLYATLVGRPTGDCERELVDHFGSGFPIDRFRAGWPEHWRAGVTSTGIRPKPGLLDLLGFLDDRGLPVAVATSSEVDYTAFSLQQVGLTDRFKVIVTGDEVARGKPAPDIYLEVARRLDVAPGACVALEDSEAGVLAASRAGMRVLMVPDGARPSDAAVHAAFRVVGSLNEAHDLIARLVSSTHST